MQTLTIRSTVIAEILGKQHKLLLYQSMYSYTYVLGVTAYELQVNEMHNPSNEND